MSSPPNRLSQSIDGTSTAISAVAERRTTATASSTGIASPSQGRNVSSRLPRLPIRLGTREWKKSSSVSPRATAAVRMPRRHMPEGRHQRRNRSVKRARG